MHRLIRAAALLWLLAPATLAQGLPGAPMSDAEVKEQLEIGTSTSEIAITSDFSGADLTVFGSLTNADQLLLAVGQYDIIVVLEGPREDATVRHKERVFGIWVNTRSMRFERVPKSYSFSSTRAIDNPTFPLDLNDRGIGIDHIPLIPTGSDASNLTDFRQAFRRLQQLSGLYVRDPSGVRFISSNLFRASLRLPANVPNGVHTVHAYVFKSGKFVTDKSLPLRVIKTGMEQMLTDAAHQRPLFYGLFAVALALLTGWVASVVFRKD